MSSEFLPFTVGKPVTEPAAVTDPDGTPDPRRAAGGKGRDDRVIPPAASLLERRLTARDALRDKELLMVDGVLRLRPAR